MINRILCALTQHRWVEQLPHRSWSINEYRCTRCHAIEWQGTFGEPVHHALARTQLTPEVYAWCVCGQRFDAYGHQGAMNKLEAHIHTP